MKKSKRITVINVLITDNPDINFDLVPEDTKEKANDLKALHDDIVEAIAEANKPPVVTLSEICKEEGKDPKTVRARTRRLYDCEDPDPDLPETLDGYGNRWTFHEDNREAVRALVLNASE